MDGGFLSEHPFWYGEVSPIRCFDPPRPDSLRSDQPNREDGLVGEDDLPLKQLPQADTGDGEPAIEQDETAPHDEHDSGREGASDTRAGRDDEKGPESSGQTADQNDEKQLDCNQRGA